jgi:hypothetical protein
MWDIIRDSRFFICYLRDFQLKKYPKIFVVRASCPLTIKDGQDGHPTKLGNLFFGVP